MEDSVKVQNTKPELKLFHAKEFIKMGPTHFYRLRRTAE